MDSAFLYRVVSGMHASISTHLSQYYANPKIARKK